MSVWQKRIVLLLPSHCAFASWCLCVEASFPFVGNFKTPFRSHFNWTLAQTDGFLSAPMTTDVPTTHTPVKKPGALRRLYNWTISWAERPGGSWALFFLALLESSFFPIPPDVLLLALCVGAPKKSFRFALICSSGSVVGGMLGYWIGMSAWHVVQGWFIPYVFSQEVFETVKGYYQGNAFLAILVAAFTPIPYKVFTVAAGVFDVNFLTFVTASIVGRSARFFLVGGVIYFFGAKVKSLVEKYFDVFAWILLVLGIAGFVTVKFLR